MGRSILLRDIWSLAVKKLCPVWFGAPQSTYTGNKDKGPCHATKQTNKRRTVIDGPANHQASCVGLIFILSTQKCQTLGETLFFLLGI
jgi:hypothetical protein